MSTTMDSEFRKMYRGYFRGVLRWHQLDALWDAVEHTPEGWYVYFVNQPLPEEPVAAYELQQFLREIDNLLRTEHDYDYCGIVYADSLESPCMVKIFDPGHLGASCGSSGQIIPPRWILSRMKPELIEDSAPIPANRTRWWQKIFSSSAG